MRKLLGVVAVLCVFTMQSQAADEKKADKTDKDKLQGTWEMTKFEIGGQAMDIPEAMRALFTFNGEKLTVKESKEAKEAGEGSFKVDDTKKVKEIDLTTPKKDDPKAMETVKAIYQLDGDTFKLYMNFGEKKDKRPADYDSKEAVVLVLKRVVKK